MSYVPYTPGGAGGYVPYTPGGFTGDVAAPVRSASHGLIHVIAGIGRGIESQAVDTYHSLGYNIHHPTGGMSLSHLLHHPTDVFATTPKGKALVKSEKDYYGHLGTNLRKGNVVPLILDASMIAAPVIGRAAAVALTPEELGAGAKVAAAVTGKYGGPAREITARVAGEPGTEIVTRTLPRSGYKAGKAILGNKIAMATTGEQGIKIARTGKSFGGETKRAAKAKYAAEQELHRQTVTDPRVVEWQNHWDKLTTPQRIAFNVIARVPIAKDLDVWKGILKDSDQPAAQQTLRLIENPRVVKEYTDTSPKVQKALTLWKGITDARQEILLKNGAIDPMGIAEGSFRHTRVLRGAELLTKSKVYRMTRGLGAQVTQLTKDQAKIVKQATKAGKKDIAAQIKVGRQSVREAGLAGGRAARFESVAATTQAKAEAVDRLRNEWNQLSTGGELGTSDLGHITEAGGAVGNVGAALVRAQTEPAIRRVQTSLTRLGEHDPVAEKKLGEQIAKVQEQFDKKDPVRQKEWKDRLGAQLTELKAQRKSMQGKQTMRRNLQEQLARHQETIASAERGGSRAETAPSIQEARLQRLGEVHDQLISAVAEHERALVAEHAHTQAAEKLLAAQEKGATSKVALRQAREARIQSIVGLRAQFHNLMDSKHELLAHQDQLETMRGRLYGGGTPEEIAKEIEAERPGLVMGYAHDQPAATKRFGRGQGVRATLNPPRPQADVFPTTAAGFRHGIIDLTGDPIGPAFFRAAKHDMQTNLHRWAMEIGRKVPIGRSLPPGYEWVKRYRGQRIPPTLSTQAEHMAATNPFSPLTHEEFDQLTGRNLTDKEIQTTEDGRYWVAVPTQVADQFRAQFDSGKTLGWKLARNITNVWRALLLRTRIPWLESNVVGNTLLAAVKYSGVEGLQSFLGMVANLAGPRKVAQLLGMDVTRKVLTDEDFRTLGLTSALRHSTAVGSQLPSERLLAGGSLRRGALGGLAPAGTVLRRGVRGTYNLLPRADRWYEQFLRKGGVMTTLREQPEVRAIYDAQKGKKSWRAAMLQGVSENPELSRLAIQEMQHGLGNFITMSPFERNQLRQLVPFYGWLREITRIAARTIVDTPGRANVLYQLGQIGAAQSPSNVPSYLLGGIPVHVPSFLGGTDVPGQQSVINTLPMNPYWTPVQIAQALEALGHPGSDPNVRNVASQLSPLLSPFFSLNRKQKIGNWTVPLGLAPAQIVTDLPEYRAAFPTKSTLYPTRGLWDRWFQTFLGNPVRTYDTTDAATRGAAGQ